MDTQDTPVQPALTPAPTSGGLTKAQIATGAVAALIMASVFAIDYFGIKAPNYLPLAMSALTAIGGHTAAKTLT